MDLADVLYIIDGSLEVSTSIGPGGEVVFEAVLYDKIHDPCMLQGNGLSPEPDSPWRYATARETGKTQQEALEALSRLIGGTSLGHSWPLMWTHSTEWIRVPPTLVVGKPVITVLGVPVPAP